MSGARRRAASGDRLAARRGARAGGAARTGDLPAAVAGSASRRPGAEKRACCFRDRSARRAHVDAGRLDCFRPSVAAERAGPCVRHGRTTVTPMEPYTMSPPRSAGPDLQVVARTALAAVATRSQALTISPASSPGRCCRHDCLTTHWQHSARTDRRRFARTIDRGRGGTLSKVAVGCVRSLSSLVLPPSKERTTWSVECWRRAIQGSGERPNDRGRSGCGRCTRLVRSWRRRRYWRARSISSAEEPGSAASDPVVDRFVVTRGRCRRRAHLRARRRSPSAPRTGRARPRAARPSSRWSRRDRLRRRRAGRRAGGRRRAGRPAR